MITFGYFSQNNLRHENRDLLEKKKESIYFHVHSCFNGKDVMNLNNWFKKRAY